MISENSEDNDSNDYVRYIAQYKEQLEKDIQFFKKDTLQIKAGTYKKVKSKHLSQYIKSNDKQLIITSYPLTWSNNKFSPTFLDVMESFDYNTLIDIIIPILSGNFTSCNLDKVYEKKISFFFSKKYDNNMTILFAIYFKRSSSDPTKVTQILEFYNLLNANSSHSRNTFINKKLCNDMKNYEYPYVEYDRTGLFHRQNMFYLYKTKIGDVDIYNPYDDIPIVNENYLFKTFVGSSLIEVLNDPNKFKHNKKTEETLNFIIKNSHEKTVTDLIINNKWQGVFSEQEMTLIQMVSPFMLSGQPGTGKTTVILVKILADLLDSEMKRCILFNNNQIDFNFIRMNASLNQFDNKFRIIFTSFSQELCDKVQNLFEKMLESTNTFINYTGIKRDDFSMLQTFDSIQQFPIFMNFRKLMFMIDSSITFQFFARTSFKYSGLTDCQITYSANQLYICNNYSSNTNAYNLQKANFFLRNPTFLGSSLEMHEVNESHFFEFYKSLLEQASWKNKKDKNVKFKKQNNNNDLNRNEDSYVELLNKVLDNCLQYNSQISSSEIYSQIHSVIKGSLDSSNYETNCISRESYVNKGKKLTMIDDINILNYVYDILLLYEKLKKEKKLFDIQDVTNHLIRRVKIELIPKQIKLIDILYIDEIQDLTINQIYLLALVSKQIKVFAGDTSQTISEVNRFRFKDLKQLFYIFSKTIEGFSPVEEAVLNLNFRLNCHVLKLSTFVNHLIQKLFPLTVDKFKEDVSLKIIPYKPVLLSYLNEIESIIGIKSSEKVFISESMTFSYNTCWLFHSTQTMERIKARYSRRRIGNSVQSEIDGMTVQECKGLEYEIVLVYNFFTDSKFRNIWYQIIQNIESRPNEDVQHGLEDLRNRLNFENFSSVIKQVEQLYPELLGEIDENYTKSYEKNKKIIIDFIISSYQKLNLPVLNNFFYFDIHKHFAFCTELKQFYVIITRPRTFLLFYEESNCNYIYDFFIKEGLIIDDSNDRGESQLKKQIWNYFQKANLKINDEQDFYFKAETEFKNKNYARASFLFKKIGFDKEALLADIYLKYETLQIRMNQRNLDEENLKNNLQNLLENINLYEKDFEDKYRIKGFCYQHLNNYKEAINEYQQGKLYQLCADVCYYKQRNYREAFKYYKMENNYMFSFLSLEKIIDQNKYIALIDYVDEIKEQIGLLEYNERYKKYCYPYWEIYLNKNKQKTLIIKPEEFVSEINQSEVEKNNEESNELTLKCLEKWKIFLMKNSSNITIHTKKKEKKKNKENKIDTNPIISEHIYNFFNRYNKGFYTIKNKENAKDETYQKLTSVEPEILDLTKRDPKIKQFLINFDCPDDLILYVKTYFYNSYNEIIKEFLFRIPSLFYFRMKFNHVSKYISKLFEVKLQKIIFLPDYSQKVQKSIQKVANNMMLEKHEIKKIIFELKAFHHFFLDNYSEYSENTQIAIDCYLSRESQINLYFIDIIEKLQTNRIILDINREEYLNLSEEELQSPPKNNFMETADLNKDLIVDSYDILVMSSFIRVNMIPVLRKKKYNNSFKFVFPQLHDICLKLIDEKLDFKNISNTITEFISLIESVVNNPDQSLTYSRVETILSLGSILSLYYFRCQTKQTHFFDEHKLIYPTKQLVFLLRNIMVDSIIKNSIRLEEIQLLVFSLYHAYGIIYLSKSKSIQELNLLKDLDICILDKNSPIFDHKNIFSNVLDNKGTVSFFDSYGYGLIIKPQIVWKIFVEFVFDSFIHVIETCNYLTKSGLTYSLNKNGHDNVIYKFLMIYQFFQFYYLFELNESSSVFQDYDNFIKCKLGTNFYKWQHDKSTDKALLETEKNKNILFHTLIISLMLDSIHFYQQREKYILIKDGFNFMINDLKGYINNNNVQDKNFFELFQIVLIELLNIHETKNDSLNKYLRIMTILEDYLEYIPKSLSMLCLKLLNNFFLQFVMKYLNFPKYDVIDYYYGFPIKNINFGNQYLFQRYSDFFQLLIRFMKLYENTKNQYISQFYELNYYTFFLTWINVITYLQEYKWKINHRIFSFFDFLEAYSESNHYYSTFKKSSSVPIFKKVNFVSNNNTIRSDICNPMKQLYKNRMLIFYGFQESGISLVTKQFPYYHEMIVEETNLSSLTCDKKIARSEWFFNRKVEVTNNIEDFLFQEHNSSETYITNYLEVMGEYRSVCPNYLELNLKETEDKEKQKRIKTNYWNKIDERIESYDKIDKQIKREILEERNNQKLKEEQEQKLEDLQEQKQEEEETHDSKPKKYKKQKRKNKKRKY